MLSEPILDSDSDAQQLARAHAHYASGVIHDMNREPELALNEYAEAIKDNSADETLVLEVTRRFIQEKQFERALALLESLTNASGTILARKAGIYSQLGRTVQAVETSREAIRLSPSLLIGYQTLFVILVQDKQEKEALAVLDDASRQQDVGPEFLAGLAELYSAYGMQFPSSREHARAGALRALERAEAGKPDSPMVQLSIAEEFYRAGQTERASRLYLEVLKKPLDPPGLRERIHGRLSEIYLQSNDHRKAMEQLLVLAEQDPTNPQVQYLLAAICLEEKKYPEAVEYLRKTILLKPDFEQAHYDLANALVSGDKPAEAIATLEEARRRFSQTFLGELLSGLAFTRQKAYSEAITHFNTAEIIAQATDQKRLNQFFYFQFGAACERRGDLVQAEQHFRKALELDADFSEAMNYLGYMWAEHGTNLVEAKALIEKAVKAEPKNAAFLDSMAWVLFKSDQPKEALPYILEAVKLTEAPDATLFDHLGDIYSATGDATKAREAWENSLKVEPNETVRKKLPPATPPETGKQ